MREPAIILKLLKNKLGERIRATRMYFNIFNVFFIVMLLGIQIGYCQSLSLRDAIFLSLAHNTNIRNDEIRRVVDKFNLLAVENRFQWQYGLAASAGYTTTKVDGFTQENTAAIITPTATKTGVYGTLYSLNLANPIANGAYIPGITMNITQPLLRGFGKDITLVPWYDAEDNEMLSRLNFKNSIIQTVTQVISAYNALIQAYNQVEVSELTLNAYKLTINNMKANIQAGRRAPTDILQVESNYASELVNLKGAKNRVETLTREFLNLIGLPPDLEISIDMHPYSNLPKIPLREKAYEIALENNIQYRADLLSIKSLRRAVLVAKDNMRPQLNLSLIASTGNGANGGLNSGLDSLLNGRNTSLSAQLNLEIPIRDYSLKQNLINTQIQLAQAELNLSQQRRTLKTIIYNNVADTETSAEQIKLTENAIDLRRKDQTFLNAKLRHGLATVFEVNTRQQELSQSLNQLINDRINYINSLTVLYANMGILLDVWKITICY